MNRFKKRQSVLMMGLLLGGVQQVNAQPGEIAVATAARGGSASLQTVVVQGQRIADSELHDLQSAAPIEVITADDIANSGSDSLIGVLQRSLPSVNIPLGGSQTRSSGRDAKSVSLHGLGAEQTLVLVDGKRRHVSGTVNNHMGRGAQVVDLNAIPLSAIERIEVLKDGAAAQYGSDAVAGVVNVVLRKNSSGGDVSAQAGNYRAKNKPEGKPDTSSIYQGWFGTELFGAGYLNASFNVSNLYRPVEGLPDQRRWYFPGDAREATVNRDAWPAHFPADEESYKAVVSLGRPLAPGVEFYGFFNYAHSEKVGRDFYTVPSNNANVRAIYPDGYGGLSLSEVDDYAAAAGVRFDDTGWGDVDVSVNYGLYDQTISSENGVTAALELATPIGYRAGGYVNSQFNADLKWSNAFELAALAHPLKVAAGLSYRKERYEIEAGEYASYARGGLILDGPSQGTLAPVAGGITPQDAGVFRREAQGLWFNIENKVAGELVLGAAGRFEDYSDFGTTETGKLWASYEFTPRLSVRAGINNSYRAPTLGQLGFASTGYSVNATNTDWVQTRSLPVDSPIARALGAQDLEAEKSVSYEAGLVWRPSDAASVAVDLYRVNIRDRVSLTGNLTGPLVSSLLGAAGYPDIGTANFFINALDTRTQGIDIVARQKLEFGARGELDLSLGFSATDTEVTDVADNPPQLAGSGLVLVTRRVEGLFTDSSPENKLILGATYKLGGLELTLTQKRYGEYKEYHQTNPDFDQTFSSQWLTDIGGIYRFDNGLYLGLGVNNVFDSRPEKQRPELTIGGFRMSKYSDLAPEGHDGTYYYGTLGYRF